MTLFEGVSRPALGNCVEEAVKKTRKFWSVVESVESGPGGLQASSEQLCKGSHKENKRVLQGV